MLFWLNEAASVCHMVAGGLKPEGPSRRSPHFAIPVGLQRGNPQKFGKHNIQACLYASLPKVLALLTTCSRHNHSGFGPLLVPDSVSVSCLEEVPVSLFLAALKQGKHQTCTLLDGYQSLPDVGFLGRINPSMGRLSQIVW
jgi:hypothetical protein